MKVSLNSSWFLPLLGFVLIGVAAQESGECPTTDQVSCTAGTKCNSDLDCQDKELCCANPCYTKRCVQNPRGGDDVDGPSESECRPYIEKALKELETGEARKEPSDENESAEELPTVEISDDDEGGSSKGNVEDIETEAPPENEFKDVEGESEAIKTSEETKSQENLLDSGGEDETPEGAEPIGDEIQGVKESSEENIEDDNVKLNVETDDEIDNNERVLDSVAKEFQKSDDLSKEITEPSTNDDSSAKSEETTSDEDERHKRETTQNEQLLEINDNVDGEEAKSDEVPVEAVDSLESNYDAPAPQEESKESIENQQGNGCPTVDRVSCTDGELCTKHKACGENRICCPNKCYRKRCVTGKVDERELQAEQSEGIESSKQQIVINDSEEIPGTGCPSSDQVSCVKGDLCSKHKHCGDGEICCPNKCYRKRCVAGLVTSEELAQEESEEDSKEMEQAKSSKEENLQVKDDEGLGCPSVDKTSCKEGDLCSKHKHCRRGEICCPNKCYRMRCVTGTVSSAELEEEELSEEKSIEELTKDKIVSGKREVVGCPLRENIPCKGGQGCLKNKECDSGEICCANKCYRKMCVPGTPAEDDSEEDDDPGQVNEEEHESTGGVNKENAEKLEDEDLPRCPSKDEVPCRIGQRCDDDNDCTPNEFCCPNKCYNKRCVVKPLAGMGVPESKLKLPKQVEKPVTKFKVEIKREVKIKVLPSEPKKETRKLEVKQPGKPSKVVVIEEMDEDEDASLEKGGEVPAVEELSLDTDIPTELRPRDHVEHLLKLDKDSSDVEQIQNRVYEETLKELKRLYESAIKPLETLYKYRDLSNRHFGDAEIFSKPLVLFMGPWSGGKSSIINYLVNNEYNETSLRTGAEPSPAYFNILMYGEEAEIIDGTELAADFTFSGLQKFGQGLEERLKGIKLPSKILRKVNVVEIPGILEVRKQVSRLFPFNDACQWFIDRADIIFLVYDPSKLDVGPETEAILDQLKGREHQTRIILNKADQVKPEELMRVQSALIWNISPLMSSPQPPIMYTASLWSRPFEPWAPVRLLQAQERAFLRDLRGAVDKRVENKIASARRFAVRVRNHAKMVDCYLTTYYNHKSVFGNRKQVANEIIEHPQDYHIYEGLSTLTNISRYDLPDPEVYKDFFKLNPLYEFQQLSATCTYFRGCPINRLDIAIAYDLPELVGTYKKNLEEALASPSDVKKKASRKAAPGS
ncbi:uncharacterized protein LOC132695841 isoform X2 [Cylas formicarius]|uniref:uncharacterized protein LOC132695841 isoform X2 n=1 Tax=Cylas formicarius TaxID=197179 RepID=UPI0029587C9B|nr:uncharacterized protein LOC132695841 isoform X2 [Cylas formicarius]